MKRNRECINEEFLQECQEHFNADRSNIIARNAVSSVGAQFSTTNSERVNELTYIFLNTVKKKNVKATNQGNSGRCWMFAALNTFRHIIIRVLDLANFEFSEVYLFFWDKFERCNTYLTWFIDHRHEDITSRNATYMSEHYMGDGGWWHTFANLVNKYGVVPKNAMTETACSGNSDEMNHILKQHLDSTVNYIFKHKSLSNEKLYKYKDSVMKEIYAVLVKFLGQPPTEKKTFQWSFHTDDDEPNIVGKLTPMKFKEMLLADINMLKDFVVLTHIPAEDMKMYQNYNIECTNNLVEGTRCSFFNVPIDELAKYAMKSIQNGVAVWFAGDVSQSFNWYYSALDDELDDHKVVFGDTKKFDKGDRMKLRNVQSNHAMAVTGFNVNEKGIPLNWQVENSWGYIDNEEEVLSGFLTMSHSWFKKYVTEIVVHKRFLSRTFAKKMDHEPIVMEPWCAYSKATQAGGFAPPRAYLDVLKLRKTN
jgi:bleomycin hydrolase